jgi:hypothetical protein
MIVPHAQLLSKDLERGRNIDSMNKSLVLFMTIWSTLGCVHSGEVVELEARGLKVSCSESDAFQSEKYTAVSCVIENVSAEIQSILVHSHKLESEDGASLPLNQQEIASLVLVAGGETSQSNEGVAAMGAVTGVGVAVQPGNRGAVMAGGGLGAGFAAVNERNRQQLVKSGFGPEDLLHNSMSINPGQNARKRTVFPYNINSRRKRGIRLCFDAAGAECILVPLNHEVDVRSRT